MASTKIIVNDNGSLRIEGDFEIVDKTGARYDLGGREIISVCRCGKSSTNLFATVPIKIILSIMQSLLPCRQRRLFNKLFEFTNMRDYFHFKMTAEPPKSLIDK